MLQIIVQLMKKHHMSFLPQEIALETPNNGCLFLCVNHTETETNTQTILFLYHDWINIANLVIQCSVLTNSLAVWWNHHSTEVILQRSCSKWTYNWAELSRAERKHSWPAGQVWIELSRVELSWAKRIRAGLCQSKETIHWCVFESVIRVLIKLKLPLCG